jgi:hypothetical protein
MIVIVINEVQIIPKMKTRFLNQLRLMSLELEKLLKIFISSFLKSLIVNKKYIVPDNAVRIKKNKNNKGGSLSIDSCSMLSFTAVPGKKEAIRR